MSAELVQKFPDVDPFLLKKWERVFHAFFDVNANEIVEWGDFYVVLRHVREIYGADSAQLGYAKKQMGILWETLVKLADKNKDEQITLDEWVTVLKKSDPKTQPKWFKDYASFMFKLFDVSADKVLDLAEYTDGMVAYGCNSSDAHAAFHKFATNIVNKPIKAVNFTQFERLWNQYFYSTDPKAKGNHLFGVWVY